MTKHRIISLFIPLLIVACTALGLTGCHVKVNVIGLSDYFYADSEKYTIGAAELSETVKTVEIDWLVGNVTITAHSSDTISFSEKSDKELSEETKLRYWLDGTTLRIRLCACGKWNLSELKKDLTVFVPDSLVIENLKVDSVSANMNLSGFAVAQSVEINTISGTLEAEFSELLNTFQGSSTSGAFKVSAPSVSHFKSSTINGVVSLSVQKEPDWLNVDTTSGKVNLNLPVSSSFTLDYGTTSGDLTSDLFYRKSAGKYIFGDGKGEYKISTVSGDVRITANAQEG